MARKDRFPDGYSSGLPPYNDLEGSGSSGRATEDSTGPQKKWINLSSVSRNGFSVPVRVLPLSKLSPTDRKSLVMRLRSELKQIRVLQKKFDMERSRAVTLSASSDLLGCNDLQNGLQMENVKKSVMASGPGTSINRPNQKARGSSRCSAGKFEPAHGSSAQGSSNLVLMKQCENLLKKLMSHQYGWVFKEPVNIVKLNIPDYFTVVKHPMDLGTIKGKIATREYSSPLEFLSDVRLTFSNSMTYNPPGNDVHFMADTLSKFFELRWKSIEKKLSGSQLLPVQEEIQIVKPMPPSKKRKVSSTQSKAYSEVVKRVMTDEEKHRLSRELEAYLADLPDNIIEFLRDQSSSGKDAGEDEIEIDIDDLSDDTLFKLRKMLDNYLQEKLSQAKAEPCVIELLDESGLSNSTMQLYKGNDLIDEDVDIGGNEPPVSSNSPFDIEREMGKRTNNANFSGSSSDSTNTGSESIDVKASSLLELSKGNFVTGADLDEKASATELVGGIPSMVISEPISGLDQVEQISYKKNSSIVSDDRQDDGVSAPTERKLSPDKIYRAAVLKHRFADTIIKAREKTLNQVVKGDPEKLRREKEELESHKRKEKARLQAEAKAAEESRRQAEAKAAALAKRKRDMEREAARQALLKMEETVEIDETSRFLETLEMLRVVLPEQLPSSADETSPEHGSLKGLGSFKLGSSNPLEQLGLYMKRDEEEEEGEPPSTILNDVEEGEID